MTERERPFDLKLLFLRVTICAAACAVVSAKLPGMPASAMIVSTLAFFLALAILQTGVWLLTLSSKRSRKVGRLCHELGVHLFVFAFFIAGLTAAVVFSKQ